MKEKTKPIPFHKLTREELEDWAEYYQKEAEVLRKELNMALLKLGDTPK